jgi:hypothetical protein
MTGQDAINSEAGPESRRNQSKLITGIIHLMRRIKL